MWPRVSRLPRVLITPHLMGRTVGPVGDRRRQRLTVETALRLLAEAPGPETKWELDAAGGAAPPG